MKTLIGRLLLFAMESKNEKTRLNGNFENELFCILDHTFWEFKSNEITVI